MNSINKHLLWRHTLFIDENNIQNIYIELIIVIQLTLGVMKDLRYHHTYYGKNPIS